MIISSRSLKIWFSLLFINITCILVLFRNILGTKNLSEILSDRETIADAMHHNLEVATDPWGVHVERNRHVMSSYNIMLCLFIYLLILSHMMTSPGGCRVEIKDVRLPQQLQRAMAAEAEATREARAKVTRMIMMMMVMMMAEVDD